MALAAPVLVTLTRLNHLPMFRQLTEVNRQELLHLRSDYDDEIDMQRERLQDMTMLWDSMGTGTYADHLLYLEEELEPASADVQEQFILDYNGLIRSSNAPIIHDLKPETRQVIAKRLEAFPDILKDVAALVRSLAREADILDLILSLTQQKVSRLEYFSRMSKMGIDLSDVIAV